MFKRSISLLDNLIHVTDVRSARISSFDQSGRNQDYWMIPPGHSVILGEIEGPGCITHIWMTSFCRRIVGPGIIDVSRGSMLLLCLRSIMLLDSIGKRQIPSIIGRFFLK